MDQNPSPLDRLRSEIPALAQIVNNKPVVYLDNACMTLKPRRVIQAMDVYYNEHPACHGRSDYRFSRLTTQAYDAARDTVRRFVNAREANEIVFTRNTTEGLNLIANGFPLKSGDVILSSDIEHNSNLLPWQRLARQGRAIHKIFRTNDDTTFNMDRFKSALTPDVKLVTVTHTANLSGVSFPIAEIIELAHKNGSKVAVDGAQAALYQDIDVRAWDVDFYVFSLHKCMGPTGMGALYGKREELEKLDTFIIGGETVEDTTYDGLELADIPDRFEGGLQNYAGGIGGGAALDLIMEIGKPALRRRMIELNARATEKIQGHDRIRIIGPADPSLRGGVLNMIVRGLPVEDAVRILDETYNVMLRAGKHCAHSWYNGRNLPPSIRLSLAPYNNEEDVDIFAHAFLKLLKVFR